jgi:hypothetical protein
MRSSTETRGFRGAALVGAICILVAGCGRPDFKNDPRPPPPVQLTGVITEQRVNVSPDRVGTGPVVITFSNQTEESHTVTLLGPEVDESIGPINPLDTATLRKTLRYEGVYTVRAGSEVATASTPSSGRLIVGRGRQSGRDDLQLP